MVRRKRGLVISHSSETGDGGRRMKETRKKIRKEGRIKEIRKEGRIKEIRREIMREGRREK